MKIAILGYSGSGKSTTAAKLGEIYNIPVLFMDTVFWLPGWQERSRRECRQLVKEFLDNNENWVIDGNYSRLYQAERLEMADIIVFFDFNRFNCLWRARRRWIRYKGKTRPSMTEGCREKFDLDFIKWILWEGKAKNGPDFDAMCKKHKNKIIVLKNQRQLDEFLGNQSK